MCALRSAHRPPFARQDVQRPVLQRVLAEPQHGRGQRDFILRRLEARAAKCADAGFDGIEYDVVDGYAQGKRVTGWRIDARAQLRFNRALARIAHSYGLAVG
jgi:hypothetical protein